MALPSAGPRAFTVGRPAAPTTIRIKISLQAADGSVTLSKMMAFRGDGTWQEFRVAASEKLGSSACATDGTFHWEGCSIEEPGQRLLSDILRDGDAVMLVPAVATEACDEGLIAAHRPSGDGGLMPVHSTGHRSLSSAGANRSTGAAGELTATAIKCSCKHSKCIKMYCQCWASQVLCSPATCLCLGCVNIQENAEYIALERARAMEKNPDVFSSRIDQRTDGGAEHKRGCRCKRSQCIKKYCECFEAGIVCTNKCRCENCQNVHPDSKGAAALAAIAAANCIDAVQPSVLYDPVPQSRGPMSAATGAPASAEDIGLVSSNFNPAASSSKAASPGSVKHSPLFDSAKMRSESRAGKTGKDFASLQRSFWHPSYENEHKSFQQQHASDVHNQLGWHPTAGMLQPVQWMQASMGPAAAPGLPAMQQEQLHMLRDPCGTAPAVSLTCANGAAADASASMRLMASMFGAPLPQTKNASQQPRASLGGGHAFDARHEI